MINLAERWFAALIEKRVTANAHRSTRELETAIRRSPIRAVIESLVRHLRAVEQV